MLASPGHSPRQIEPPSPSPSQASLQLSVARPGAGKPPLPKKRKQAVLDEETYVDAIERIIERDFFPDIPKLQNRLDWLEAIRSGDPEVIRDAQLKIIRRRAEAAGVATPGVALGTPFATPASVMPGVSPAPTLGQPAAEVLVEGQEGMPNTKMSLDEFLQKYTSEDNESFSKILEKVNKKRKQKYAYLESGPDGETARLRLTANSQGQLEGGRPTDGYGTSNQPEARLEMWNHEAKSALMYGPAGAAPLTQEELQQQVKGPPKEVNKHATRFHASSLDSSAEQSSKGPEDLSGLATPRLPGDTPMAAWPFAERRAEQAKRKYDLHDLRRTPMLPQDSPKVAGYSYVATPSPGPGDESPFMTWGDIEGTPLRLEAEDTPLDIGGSADGPQFKMPAPVPRDRKAQELSRKAAGNIRARQQGTPRASPSPARGSSTPLSAAAHRLVSAARAKAAAGIDAGLRASYRASPARVPGRLREGSIERTPLGTPSRTPMTGERRP